MEIIIIWAIIYFLPTIIAGVRHKKNGGGVIVINLFLGWTFIGWVVAFAMAFGEKEEDEEGEPEDRYIPEEKAPEKPMYHSEDKTMNEIKKEKLSKLLDDWADGKISEEEYKIKKEKIIIS